MTAVTQDPLLRHHDQGQGLRILVGDDQPDILEALRLLLKGAGYQNVLVDSPQALLRAARSEPFDLILMDLNYARDTTSGEEGLDLLSSLEAQSNAAPVIVMTAWSNVDLAVEAMRRGACDFVQKPWDNARLLSAIRKQAVAASARDQGRSPREDRTRNRAQRPAEAVSSSDPPAPWNRLCRPLRARPRSERRLL